MQTSGSGGPGASSGASSGTLSVAVRTRLRQPQPLQLCQDHIAQRIDQKINLPNQPISADHVGPACCAAVGAVTWIPDWSWRQRLRRSPTSLLRGSCRSLRPGEKPEAKPQAVESLGRAPPQLWLGSSEAPGEHSVGHGWARGGTSHRKTNCWGLPVFLFSPLTKLNNTLNARLNLRHGASPLQEPALEIRVHPVPRYPLIRPGVSGFWPGRFRETGHTIRACSSEPWAAYQHRDGLATAGQYRASAGPATGRGRAKSAGCRRTGTECRIALSLCTGQFMARPPAQPTTARPRPPHPFTPHAQTLSHQGRERVWLARDENSQHVAGTRCRKAMLESHHDRVRERI